MSGRVWMVRYQGEDVAHAERVISEHGPEVFTHPGVFWRAKVVARASDGSYIDVELWPLDSHQIHPFAGRWQIPMRAVILS